MPHRGRALSALTGRSPTLRQPCRAVPTDGTRALPRARTRDLRALTGQVVPLLAGRGLFRPGRPGTGLRARFGLPRPAHRYAVEAAS